MKLAGFLFKVLLLMAVVAGIAIVALMSRAGQYRDVVPLAAGECRRYSGAPGAEDLEVHRESSTLIISSDDRRAGGVAAGERASAGLFVLDLGRADAEIQPLAHDFAGPLRPHGIHLVEAGADGVLFVVNHGDGHSIEIFRFGSGPGGPSARHLRTVRDRLLISPNDVAGLDERRFYVTNDHGPGGPTRQQLDDLLGRHRGSVAYWDGGAMRLVAEELGFPNGVALNPENQYLYVAETLGGRINVYSRVEEGEREGDLDVVKQLEIDSGVDNLEVDLYGGLWVAAHPHLWSFLRHARDASVDSPSQIFWVDPAEDMEPWLRPVWVDDGAQLSGASVAVPFGARFAIGSVFESDILICDRS
ncbi:MAG: hypothetical protein DWQ36_17165 [Acidobacteria bacterium]|nr:MAG: hypothetical protein DWQ30_05260 [Acidobacteriota bacterium]REK04579.1 MAG: hypothetical protein DWQ36_17165 [Acidobacteriota bacterium]